MATKVKMVKFGNYRGHNSVYLFWDGTEILCQYKLCAALIQIEYKMQSLQCFDKIVSSICRHVRPVNNCMCMSDTQSSRELYALNRNAQSLQVSSMRCKLYVALQCFDQMRTAVPSLEVPRGNLTSHIIRYFIIQKQLK